jgi:dihydroorotate dehydrogenase
MSGLALLSRFPRACERLWRRVPELPIRVAGLRFPNPIGLAAGLDKDAVAVAGLFALGFGAVEIGTVTPRPQPGNPRPRVFRRTGERALINRMGFPSEGMDVVAARLERLRFRPGIVGVNVGKNKDTPLDAAADDYRAAAAALARFADYVVVNASSPNTPGLRRLQEPERLAALLAGLDVARPTFVKIAPDLASEEIDAIVDVAIAARVAGVIATNTTVVAEPEAGGLSGAPLRDRSTEVVRRVARRAAGRIAVIGVGGIATAEDAYAKIRAGASLVQVYTGFIYEGPGLARRLVIGLTRLLERDRLSLEEAVGRDI